ncbi:antibiotic biosynthesis monooxygenase family protein [Sorangium sp. So ce315]|uniref:antibiotic biosynthesis monooxygenase family protein n=1 Tax=Sorangium sp. So ce315 TaxID=3133299 RepID=UPI003F5DE727
MFIVVNTITASAPALQAMVESFRRAAPEMRQFSGFLGLEIWLDDGSLKAVSRWESREAFQEYPRSEVFRRHHRGMAGEQALRAAHITFYEGEIMA